MNAVIFGFAVGDPEHLLPELLVYSGFVMSLQVQLFLAPITFLNYCMITSVEDIVQI
jgi:hypothetical protein